jgi:hypothetical protein
MYIFPQSQEREKQKKEKEKTNKKVENESQPVLKSTADCRYAVLLSTA